MKGKQVGSYIIEDKIGAGGMGVVYSAKHARMNRKAVVKVLHKHLIESAEIAKRFENEANAAASIGHPGIVQVFDIGQQEDGSLYIVMELLGGESLQDRLDRFGKLPVNQAITLVSQCADALGAAHAAGIIHRDLKPDNIFVVPDSLVAGGERTKLLDFGIAKLQIDGVATMGTTAGALMGTPPYMSPEQCQGAGGVQRPSDLYSLGCILFQLVTGRTPFVGQGIGDYIIAHTTKPPPLLRSLAPEAPVALEDIVSTLLAKNPEERFASCAALVAALGSIDLGAPNRMAPNPLATRNLDPRTASIGEGGVGAPPASSADPRMASTKVAGKAPGTTLGLSAGQKVDAPQSQLESEDRHYAKQSRSKTKIAVLGTLFTVAVAGVGIAVLSTTSSNQESAVDPVVASDAQVEMVSLKVHVNPTNAELFVDGEPVASSTTQVFENEGGGVAEFVLELERDRVVHLELRSPGYESVEQTLTAAADRTVTVTLANPERQAEEDRALARRSAWVDSPAKTRFSVDDDAISARGRFKVTDTKTTISMRYDEVSMTCEIEFGADGNPSKVISCTAKGEPFRIKSKAFQCKVSKSNLTCRASNLKATYRKETVPARFQISRPVIAADQPSDSAGKTPTPAK